MTIRDDTGRELLASDARVPLEDAAFLRAVLEAVPAFILRLDPDRRINYINHLRPGVTLAEVIGKPATEYISAGHHERFNAAVDQALRTGQQASFDVNGQRGDRTLYFEGLVVPIDHGDGRSGVCVVTIDVTQRVANSAALQASEEKLRIAVEATGIGLWSWDPATDRLEWSPRMVEITGHAAATGTEYVERVVHPDDRERIRNEFQSGPDGEGRLALHRIVRPDGEVRWLMPCGRQVTSEAGSVVRLRGGTLDVTAHRKLEERVRQSQKLDALGSLTAGVAHNFNNMLAVIVPALDLAARGARGANGVQEHVYLDAVQAARRATDLVSQLMMFAGQRRVSAPMPHDVPQLVERAVSMCRSTFERRLQIETAIDRSCPPVVCDATAIEQVIVNLMINARDALVAADRNHPRITLELSSTDAVQAEPGRSGGPYARIRIEDNGTGMSELVKQRLFEPFFTTKEPGKGTGLGLATSYGIVRDHGGFIAFDSQLGRGTIAELFLPIATGVDASEVLSERAPALAAEPHVSTILVVDDEPALRRMVDLVLRRRGHEVVLAADGQAAISQLDGGVEPDLILLDRSMPGLPIKATLAEIRKRCPDTPVIFFTGQDVTPEERAAVQDVLYKPLTIEELIGSVEKWLI